jgi:hypothetical protein
MFGHDAGFDIRVAEWAIRWVHSLTDISMQCQASEAGGTPSKVIELGREVYKVGLGRRNQFLSSLDERLKLTNLRNLITVRFCVQK